MGEVANCSTLGKMSVGLGCGMLVLLPRLLFVRVYKVHSLVDAVTPCGWDINSSNWNGLCLGPRAYAETFQKSSAG